MNFKLVLISIVFSLFFFSCQKDDNNSVNKPIEDYSVVDGVLHVKNQQVLNDLIEQTLEKNIDEVRAWQESLGFESYSSFYEDVFSEYEQITENMSTLESLLDFIDTYKEDVIFPGGTTSGEPNYIMRPKVTPELMSLANRNGELIVNGKQYVASSSLKATLNSCDKIDGKRKMWVYFSITSTGSKYARVEHSKKTWFGWSSYKTKYYWRFSSTNPGYYYTNSDVSSGYNINFPSNITYVEVWNRGVGENDKCSYNYGY